MSRKKKFCMIISSVCVSLILAVVVLSQFVAVSTDVLSNVGGGTNSVVFDKAVVMSADRIVVREGEKVVTITDKALVREIASAFVVANRTDLCGYYDDKWMEIYNGDKLVRNIHWNAHDELAEVYEADGSHWVWPSSSKVGQVELSREFVERLNEIIQAHSG